MHMSFRAGLTVPPERAIGKINMDPKAIIQWFPDRRDLLSLRNRVGRYKCTRYAYRSTPPVDINWAALKYHPAT